MDRSEPGIQIRQGLDLDPGGKSKEVALVTPPTLDGTAATLPDVAPDRVQTVVDK